MQTQKYSVQNQSVQWILTLVNSGEIAIPEIQRPFVWDTTQVRNLIDSLYKGYPVGYIITWKNPNIKLKDGSLSEGKKIVIDGQQRIAALSAALLGHKIVDKDYKKERIKIAFQPIEERFEVLNPAILKDKTWIPDIAEALSGGMSPLKMIRQYQMLNLETDEDVLERSFSRLVDIPKIPIGVIDLAASIDIDIVTEIFIRINQTGTKLSQADFAMSKIAANETFGGNMLRKAIDYFCHLAVLPDFYHTIVDKDPDFATTSYFQQMRWLRNETDDLYDPSYTDMIRVAFTSQFNRGKISDLVSLLSGRNFETKTFEEEIAEASYDKLKKGVMNFMNEANFKKFTMIIRSAGFVSPKLVRSQNALNFAYILYLKLKSMNHSAVEIEHYVRRWFVYSVLTGRYSGSPESMFDFDIKQVASCSNFGEYLAEKERGELSDAYWEAALPQSLDTSVASSPYFHVFIASQIKNKDNGFLSRDITVENMIIGQGDVHHIFPRDYLKRNSLLRGKYNQIANYVYMQSEINIKVGNKAPFEYFKLITDQIESGNPLISGISNMVELKNNLKSHCIPESIIDSTIEHYDEFLVERRKLMALKMRDYYFSL